MTSSFLSKFFYRLRYVILPFIISLKYRIFPIKDKISQVRLKTNGIKFLMKLDTDGKGRFPVINTKLLRILGSYEPETSSVLFSEINKGDTVIEIGAAYGYFTAQISKLVGKSGRVISIEPSNDMNTVCAETIKLNNLYNVDLVKKAFIPFGHKIDFFHSYETIDLESLIKIYNLDSIDFIFIDVDSPSKSGDGLRQELELLSSILPIVKKLDKGPKIFLEYVEHGKDSQKIFELLSNFGYVIEEVTKRHFLCVAK